MLTLTLHEKLDGIISPNGSMIPGLTKVAVLMSLEIKIEIIVAKSGEKELTTSSMIAMGINPHSSVFWDLPHPHSSLKRLSKRNTSPASILYMEEEETEEEGRRREGGGEEEEEREGKRRGGEGEEEGRRRGAED